MISFIINQWGRVRSAYIIQEWRAVLGLALIPLSIIISVYIWQEKFDSSQPGGAVFKRIEPNLLYERWPHLILTGVS